MLHRGMIFGFVLGIGMFGAEWRSALAPLAVGAGGSWQCCGATDWPGWRGPQRNAVIESLPDRLSSHPKCVWKKGLSGEGISGIAAADGAVIIADRDAGDTRDIFRCLDAGTGREAWRLEYRATGKMAGNGKSPRATPLIHDRLVYTLGAFGDVHCVDLRTGVIVWKKVLPADYGVKPPAWGYCASPLIVGENLILSPGGKQASLVALNRQTGREVWRAPGGEAAYASLIEGTFGGTRQIVGYDAVSLGGWDVVTGKRLWTMIPPTKDDFNVPSPIAAGNKLILCGDTNGTRLYGFNSDARLRPTPASHFDDLAPDAATPVLVGNKLYGCWFSLYCLEVGEPFKPRWTLEDKAFEHYASIVAAPNRLLVFAASGELLLIDTRGDTGKIVSRLTVFPKGEPVLSHPAVTGRLAYFRGAAEVVCLDLGDEGTP